MFFTIQTVNGSAFGVSNEMLFILAAQGAAYMQLFKDEGPKKFITSDRQDVSCV